MELLMREQQADISQMRAITISRQYGSGGGEIARRLAQRLQWRLFDHEAVVRVADAMGISEAEAEAQDENAPDFWSSLAQSLQFLQPPVGVALPQIDLSVDLRTYLEAISRVVKTACDEGHVVIVGREGQVLLAEHQNVLHIRVVAPLEPRINYVMQREGLSREDAEARLHEKDSNRNRLLKTQYHESPDNPLLYDLVINTSTLSISHAVDMIVQALRAKAEQILAEEQYQGPGSGLSRYPGSEHDLPTPSVEASQA
jgi:cytidylate kinase